MSIIVKEKGQYKMYIKGADNVIEPRLTNNCSKEFNDKLFRLSSAGLRILLLGVRIIS